MHRRFDAAELKAIDDVESGRADFQPADQTDEAGSEKEKANGGTDRPEPARDQLPPEEWQHDEIRPDDELGVIPTPRRGFDEKGEEKDGQGGNNEGQGGRQRK